MTLSPALRKCGWWLAAVAAVAVGIVLWMWLGPEAQLAGLRAAVAGTMAADGLGMAAGLVAVAGLGAGLAGRPAPDFAQAPTRARRWPARSRVGSMPRNARRMMREGSA